MPSFGAADTKGVYALKTTSRNPLMSVPQIGPIDSSKAAWSGGRLPKGSSGFTAREASVDGIGGFQAFKKRGAAHVAPGGLWIGSRATQFVKLDLPAGRILLFKQF